MVHHSVCIKLKKCGPPVGMYNRNIVVHNSMCIQHGQCGPLQCLHTITTMWSIAVCFKILSSRVHNRVFIHSEKCGPPQCVCPVWAVWSTTANVHCLSSVVRYCKCPQPEQSGQSICPFHWCVSTMIQGLCDIHCFCHVLTHKPTLKNICSYK